MNKIKNYFKYVNQWDVIFYVLILIQIWSSYIEHNLGLHTLWSIGLVWALFMLGYNSLDRDLEINLDRALEEMTVDATQNTN